MLKKIRVVPLAAESLGTRSMCTHVETPTSRILLDAGVSLCPNRFGLPPHPLEYEAIKDARRKIANFAEKADAVTISHYHFDHHTPSFVDWFSHWTDTETARQIYENKPVLAKNFRVNVNPSQRRRGWVFTKTGGRHAERVEFADGKSFFFGDTEVKFSTPVFHGLKNSPLGWVLMTAVQYEDEKVFFASDVQGPMNTAALQIIAAEEPQLAIVGGPPTYLAGFRVDDQQIKAALRNLETLSQTTPVVIVDHHLLRDENWRDTAKQALALANEAGNRLVTAAEYLGEKNCLLEARRKHLFQDKPPSPSFMKWAKSSVLRSKKTRPPL